MPVSESACRRNSPSFFNAAWGGRPAAGAWGALAAVARFLVASFQLPCQPLPSPLDRRSPPNCFVAHDANRQQLAYVYYENEPGRRSAAKLLTKDWARRRFQ